MSLDEDKAASADKLIYLQRVELFDICFLQETLYWVAFGRLPVWLARSEEMRPTPIEDIDGALTDDECKNSTPPLPPDPRHKYDWSFGVTLCDDLAAIEACAEREGSEALDGSQGESIRTDQVRIEAAKLHKDISEWKPNYERAIELATAKVYVALREGRLTSKGVLRPGLDPDVSLKPLADQGKKVTELEYVTIPKDFWWQPGINWEISAARNNSTQYCLIHCPTEEVMSLFPHHTVADGVPVEGLVRHGSFFVLLSDSTALSSASPARRSQSRRGPGGAPPKYPWAELDVEIAFALAGVRRGDPLPKRDSLVKELQAVSTKRGWPCPAERTLLDRLARFYERLGENR
jgi:hypothetical protein